jgi:hypothetical protein
VHRTSIWWPEPKNAQALVTIKAAWCWNALHTQYYQHRPHDVPRHWNPVHECLEWREFRVLCAVLSVIGKKSFAWISTATLAHRILGFTSARFHRLHLAKINVPRQSLGEFPETETAGATSCPRHLASLSRWQIESTLADLEKNRFFLRFRASSSTSGRGGRTAYSIRHKTRPKLAKDLHTALTKRRSRGKITLEGNRGKDVVLWRSGKGKEVPNDPLDLPAEDAPNVASPIWLTLPPA